jgi:hypothetical protein
MTTYNFIGKASSQSVNWNDPSVWAGGVFPNSSTADVVFPKITTSGGNIYTSFVTISNAQSYSANTVSITDNYLLLGGTLSVTNAVNVVTGGAIDVTGGTLSAGSLSLAADSFGLQGSGQVDVAGTISNAGLIAGNGNGLTISSAALSNAGTLWASSGNLTVTVVGGGFSNLSGSTLIGGTYNAGDLGNTAPNVLDLDVGGVIVTDAANIIIGGGGSIQSFDSGSGEYVPLQSSLTTIAQGGALSLADQTYTWSHALTDDGTLTLSYIRSNQLTLNAPQLIVGSNGRVGGVGTIAAPINNSGNITAGFMPSGFAFPIASPANNLLEIDGPVTGTGTLAIGPPYQTAGLNGYTFATLQLDGPVSENVIFPSFFKPGGTLILNDLSGFTGSIAPGTGGTIVVSGVSYSSVTGYSYSGDSAGGTLRVQESGGTITLNFTGDLDTADFTLSAGPQPLSTSPPSLAINFNPSPPPNFPSSPNSAAPAGTTANMILNNHTNGNYEIYNIGGDALLAAYYLGQIGTPWHFAALGTFRAGDTGGMLLRNSGTGGFQVYDISNNNVTGSAFLGNVGLNWRVMGFGNFSSLGENDMILRNSGTGGIEVYDISNNQITGAAFLGTVGLNWQMAGVSNHGTQSDLVLRDSGSGGLEIYNINNNQITGAAFLDAVGLDWQVSGFGDFSSSNEGDMLLRNRNTGGLELYDISNNQITAAFFLGTVGLDWQFAGIASIHAAGASDLVLRNVNTGAFEVYDIANNQLTGAASLGSVGLDWRLGGFAANPPGGAMGSSDNSTARLVQAMAGFGGGGAGESLNATALSADTSQQSLLTTPQHG